MDEIDTQLTEQMGGELLEVILTHLKHKLADRFGVSPTKIATIFDGMDKSGLVERLADIGFEIVGEVSENAETDNTPE